MGGDVLEPARSGGGGYFQLGSIGLNYGRDTNGKVLGGLFTQASLGVGVSFGAAATWDGGMLWGLLPSSVEIASGYGVGGVTGQSGAAFFVWVDPETGHINVSLGSGYADIYEAGGGRNFLMLTI